MMLKNCEKFQNSPCFGTVVEGKYVWCTYGEALVKAKAIGSAIERKNLVS